MVLRVNVVPVPVIVNVKSPFGAGWLVMLTRSVDVPLPVTDVGVNVADVNGGKPVTLKATFSLNPPLPVTVTV